MKESDKLRMLAYVTRTDPPSTLCATRDLYVTFRNFRARVSDFIRYRRITSNMHRRFPDATREDIEREPTCIVCREQMKVPDASAGDQANFALRRDLPKTLPCGHTFHLGCLRSWLERQQSCPTCRAPVNVSSSTVNDGAGIGNGDVGGGALCVL